jgi:uncharacterized protein (TIGR03382 family)
MRGWSYVPKPVGVALGVGMMFVVAASGSRRRPLGAT